MKKIIFTLMILSLLFVVGCANNEEDTNLTEQNHQGNNNQNQLKEHDEHISVSDYLTEELSESEIEAINAALDDEFKARAVYDQVINQFGEVTPFSNIINAEVQHANSLKELYVKYDLEMIEDKWTGNIPDIESVDVACEVGVQAEIDNAALYDGLFAQVDNQDIIAVFTSLRDASQDKHLPAFERCVARN